MIKDNIIMSAISLAREVQMATDARRKYSNKPYIYHPLRVMSRVAIMPNASSLEIAGALLHDVHEDKPFVPLERIERQIHPQVAKYVGDLTNPSKRFAKANGSYPEEWPRSVRKELDATHLSKCDFWTQTIKAADRFDNIEEMTFDMQGNGTKPPLLFVFLYCKETDFLLDMLTKIHKTQREEIQAQLSTLRAVAEKTFKSTSELTALKGM
jgi:(p)ppGpp synthase/HD superfamily hydrolase